MPRIQKNEQQVIALAEIEDALATVKSINGIIASAGEEGEYAICVTPKDSKVVKILSGAQEKTKIKKVLSSQKTRLVNEINSKAARYKIELDEDDLLCMGD